MKRSTQKTKCDNAWKKIIHTLYTDCALKELGDCAGRAEAHHLITRANIETRHCVQNGVLLCSKHHRFGRDASAHTAPIAFIEYLHEHYPKQMAWEKANRFKVGRVDYEEILHGLNNILRALESVKATYLAKALWTPKWDELLLAGTERHG
jgi:hypothetical protein